MGKGTATLLKASQNGNLAVITQLLKAGASVGEIDKDGSGAVHRAAREGHVRSLEVNDTNKHINTNARSLSRTHKQRMHTLTCTHTNSHTHTHTLTHTHTETHTHTQTQTNTNTDTARAYT